MEHETEKLELIESSIYYIRRLSSGIRKETDLIRTRGTLNIMPITEIIEGLNDLLRAVLLTSDITGISRQDSIDTTKECIKGILEACENNDSVYVTDSLEYEVLSIIEAWRAKFVEVYKNKTKNK